MDTLKLLERATGGQASISPDSVSPSKIRPLIFSDPGIAWLSEFGSENGYQKDSGKYRRLPFVSKLGADFEHAYVTHEAPEGWVRLLQNNSEVRKRESFEKTIEHLQNGTQFMWQAALWWQPQQIYGVADALVHTDWLYKRYPHLKPTEGEPPHYCVIEFKYSSNLTSSAKRAHLEHASAQTRIYSYILGHLQGYMPGRAYVISRDTIDSPIVVEVDMELDQPLDEELTDLRDAYLDIKIRGADLRPWKDKEVELNPLNDSDEPFHDAKQDILKNKVRPRSLLMLPGVGPEVARKMRLHGFKDVDDLLKRNIDRLRFEDVDGISPAMAERLRAILRANKTGKASEIPFHPSLRRVDIPVMFDVEYLSSLKADFSDYPNLSGSRQIFMIGCQYRSEGTWKFKRFTSAEDTFEAEAKMLRQFLAFMRKLGVFDPSKTAALYHWSSAEEWQARQAAERHGLWQLQKLPLVDLRDAYMEGPICLPNCWNFGLKEIAEAVGDYAPYYRVEWPEGLSSGQAAQIAGWIAYEDDEPLKTPEMRLIAKYLEQDCRALERLLAWARNTRKAKNQKTAMNRIGWYCAAVAATVNNATPVDDGGWYAYQIARME